MPCTYKGLWYLYLSRLVLSINSYTHFQSYFLTICRGICKTSSYSCIEVKDKHRVYLPSVLAQNTEYFGLYHNSQLRCDVTPTSRIIISINIISVDIITCKMDRGALAKIRLSAHKLEIERGRYAKIDREERLCKICAGNAIENETHFLWDCSKYENERNIFINSTHISNVCNSFHYLNPGTKSAVILKSFKINI